MFVIIVYFKTEVVLYFRLWNFGKVEYKDWNKKSVINAIQDFNV
jgi:hypothetical protein